MTEAGSERTWVFADGPTTSVTREVAAPPAALWPHVSDIAFPVAASPELQRVGWLGDVDQPVVGARFEGHNQRGEFQWTVECEVVACEAPRTFAWSPIDDRGDPLATWRFDLEPVEGGTRVTQTVLLGPGRSGITWAIRQRPDDEAAIISSRLAQFEEAMAANLERLAEVVQAEAADSGS